MVQTTFLTRFGAKIINQTVSDYTEAYEDAKISCAYHKAGVFYVTTRADYNIASIKLFVIDLARDNNLPLTTFMVINENEYVKPKEAKNRAEEFMALIPQQDRCVTKGKGIYVEMLGSLAEDVRSLLADDEDKFFREFFSRASLYAAAMARPTRVIFDIYLATQREFAKNISLAAPKTEDISEYMEFMCDLHEEVNLQNVIFVLMMKSKEEELWGLAEENLENTIFLFFFLQLPAAIAVFLGKLEMKDLLRGLLQRGLQLYL